MKKMILILSVMFSIGMLFTGCKENAEKEENATEIDKIGSEETGMDEMAYSEFSQFDSNRDGKYDKKEFGETYKNEFKSYDENQDGSLDQEEFYATTFSTIDQDQNDSISEDEFQRSKSTILKERAGDQQMNSFDTNNDKNITQQEWRQGFQDSDWFVNYDSNKDDLIQQEEWNSGFFDDWDLDNDGSLNEEEYNSFSSGNLEETKMNKDATKQNMNQNNQTGQNNN